MPKLPSLFSAMKKGNLVVTVPNHPELAKGTLISIMIYPAGSPT
jgi:hypothetical protein